MIRHDDGTPVDPEILRKEHCQQHQDIKDRDELIRFLWRTISESPAPPMSVEHRRMLDQIAQPRW